MSQHVCLSEDANDDQKPWSQRECLTRPPTALWSTSSSRKPLSLSQNGTLLGQKVGQAFEEGPQNSIGQSFLMKEQLVVLHQVAGERDLGRGARNETGCMYKAGHAVGPPKEAS